MVDSCAPNGCNPFNHLIVRRSMRSLVPHIILAIAVVLVSLVVTVEYPGSVHVLSIGDDWLVPLPLGLLLCAVVVIRPIFLMYDSRLELNCHHLHWHSGRMSLRNRNVNYTFEDLLGVEVDQTIIDRLLGVGALKVGTAVVDKRSIVLQGVSNPTRWAEVIAARIDAARINSRNNVTRVGHN